MNITQKNYIRLLEIVPCLFEIEEAAKSISPGFMDLNVDLLIKQGDVIRIALSHYYKVNMDAVADPDMEMLVNRKTQTVEALTYQDTYSFQNVADETGEQKDRLSKKLNEFLAQWLKNLKEQRHKIV